MNSKAKSDKSKKQKEEMKLLSTQPQEQPQVPVDSVFILGKSFDIKEVEVAKGIDATNCGHTDFMQQVITVVPTSLQQTKDTVLHEVLHCLEYSVQLKLEEEQVHALSALLLTFLWENPELAAWLISQG